jgi:hypothetical protein
MRKLHALLGTLLLIQAPPSLADRYSSSPSIFDTPLSFGVYVESIRSDWLIGDREVDTDLLKIGFGFAEHFSSGLQAGLFGGYSGLTEQNNPVTEGIGQSGAHIGLLIRGFPYKGEHFEIDTGGTIAYQYVTGSRDQQDTETSWAEGLVYAKGVLKFNAANLSAGANYQYINGTEKTSGLINRNSDIRAKDNASAMAGIDFKLGGGIIGIHGEAGARNSFSLVFGRDF